MIVEPMFDAHAHIMSADDVRYPPSAEGRSAATAPYEVEQLLADMQASGVSRACAVQRFHYYFVDNSYVLDASRPRKQQLSPVVMLDGLDGKASMQLRSMAKRQPIAALRLATLQHTRYDTAWLNSPSTLRLWEEAAKLGIPVCVIGYVRHLPYNLPALGMLAEMFPDTPIVVDHLGLPHAPIKFLAAVSESRTLPPPGPPDYGISQALKALREHPNVHYKLTGLNLEYLEAMQVDAAQLMRRFVDEFGAERILCGTDVGQTAGPYARIVGAVRQSLSLLSDAERAAVLFGTANRLFGASMGPA